MLITMTAVWGAGLALFLAHRSMLCLGRLFQPQRQRPPRPRRLDRQMARNQVDRSRQRQQPRRVPVFLLPHHGRNGEGLLRHSRSLRGER